MVDIQSAAAEIRRGKTKKEIKIEKNGKNIMSAMQGGHNKRQFETNIAINGKSQCW